MSCGSAAIELSSKSEFEKKKKHPFLPAINNFNCVLYAKSSPALELAPRFALNQTRRQTTQWKMLNEWFVPIQKPKCERNRLSNTCSSDSGRWKRRHLAWNQISACKGAFPNTFIHSLTAFSWTASWRQHSQNTSEKFWKRGYRDGSGEQFVNLAYIFSCFLWYSIVLTSKTCIFQKINRK